MACGMIEPSWYSARQCRGRVDGDSRHAGWNRFVLTMVCTPPRLDLVCC